MFPFGWSQMAVEMAEQPDVLRRLIARRGVLHPQITRLVPPDLHGVAFAGRGSSSNAAMVGRTLAELATRRPTLMAAPSLDRLYGARTDYSGFLGVGLSLSGRTPEVSLTLADMRDRGAATIAITDEAHAPISTAAHLTIDVAAGREIAVPTTKGFTAQVAALVILAEALGHHPAPYDAWHGLPDATQCVLDDWESVAVVTQALAAATELSVVAAGTFVGVAHEIALKLQETSLVAASAYSAASYRHGPMALAGPRHPLIAVSSPGRPGIETLRLAADVAARHATVIVIGVDGDLPVPRGLPEPLAAVPATVRGQQLALALAVANGHDPDRPPALSKVTVT